MKHWTNYHCHSTFDDGRAEAEEFVKEAIKQNVKTLGFSGHSPMPFETVYSIPNKDYQKYIDRITFLKEQYKNDIEIISGLEVDYLPDQLDATYPIFSEKDFDFHISSVHYGGRDDKGEVWFVDGPQDYFEEGFSKIFNKDAKAYVEEFAKNTHQMIDIGGFDIVGHIDKVYQHGHRYFSIEDKWYRSLMLELCEHARDANKIVEINTKSFTRLHFFYPHQDLFNELCALKIPMHINSDTHDPHNICNSFTLTAQLLLDSGFKTLLEWDYGEWVEKEFDAEGIYF